jgi:hypothetical protein
MKHLIAQKVRLAAAMSVTVAVIGLSSLAMQAPHHTENAMTLKSIQTDKTTLFYANARPSCAWFVEAVLPGTGESKAATENLKAVVATL